MIKRIAANKMIYDDIVINLCFVEISDGIVSSFQPLKGEIANTEWIGGTIQLVKNSRNELIAIKDDRTIK